MKENTERLRKKAIAEIQPLIEQLAREGLRGKELLNASESAVKSRIRAFYKQGGHPEHVSLILTEIMGVKPKADSKAEHILYRMLEYGGIDFKFQYPIGPYNADFLVSDNLVVELDGPGHNKARDETRDAYMRSMGYFILRVPIWILAINHQAVIDEIRSCTTK